MSKYTNLSTPEWARQYIDRGFNPIPLKANDKAPVSHGWTTQQFTDGQIDAAFSGKNIGLRLGRLIDVDLDSPEAVRLAPAFLTQTGMVFGRESTGLSHFMYRLGEDESLSRTTYHAPDGTLLVEVRGQGHQTMVPGSTHPSGETVEWAVFNEPTLTTVAKLEERVGAVATAAMLGREWRKWDSRRHAVVMALAGGLLRGGWSVDNVLNFIQIIGAIGGDTDWEDRLKAIESTAAKLEAGDEQVTGFPKLTEIIGGQFVQRIIQWLELTHAPANDGEFTDVGNAERLYRLHGDNFRYDVFSKCFMVWDGKRWNVDLKNQVQEWAKESQRERIREAADVRDPDKRNAMLKFALQSMNRARIDATTALVQSIHGVPIEPTDYNKDPLLFNCQNGTINLRTGGLQPHDPRDLITYISPFDYHPGAEAPLWHEFLSKIMDGDDELVAFLQRLVGYGLSGDVSEQKLPFFYGEGGNGKSTFIESVLKIMGDYALKLPNRFFEKKRNGSDPTDMQDLPGKRFAVSNELSDGARIDDALTKDATGNDKQTARRLYGRPYEFNPTAKFVIYGNKKPGFNVDDGGLTRRILLVPFTINIPESERDLHFADKLDRELPGILAWMVEGFRQWRLEGLNPPAQVRAATNSYLHEQDPVGRFLEECTSTGERVLRDDLFDVYVEWSKDNGEDTKSRRELMSDLNRRGIKETKSHGVAYRSGVKLTPEWSQRINTRRVQIDFTSPKVQKGPKSA